MRGDHIVRGVGFQDELVKNVSTRFYSVPRGRHHSKHLLGGNKHERQVVSGNHTLKNSGRRVDVS
ncbi:MAG: hypothetical protein CMJ81_22420 [Planctomycetaceae bacterium]|nr:hypothetical protein [Planctomycetaceae bacterium]MBP62293.1 hypothetical protein [Planctomycetaceae bacterium]